MNKIKRAFTLIEIIIVIIIVGILAALGLVQYSNMVERGRVTEARMRIGVMRQLATEYYWENGSLTGLTQNWLGVNNTCAPDGFYRCRMGTLDADSVNLSCVRCVAGEGGKQPDGVAYNIYMRWTPSTGLQEWFCVDSDGSCVGRLL
ncbi:MAG: prepilin-type N-terminal cleavage/methylation domain-containing protein [Candidatus Omnitrophica bacterium]|nr:prepilin-type N-terminal cleavage/methylation domain-containing protein [Candidatus Omnitrophota bacterium]